VELFDEYGLLASVAIKPNIVARAHGRVQAEQFVEIIIILFVAHRS
jgi:hypothetical protein